MHVCNFFPQCRSSGHGPCPSKWEGRERPRAWAKGRETGWTKVADRWPQKSAQPTAVLGKALASTQDCRNSGACSPGIFLPPFPDRHQLPSTPPSLTPASSLDWFSLFVAGVNGKESLLYILHFSCIFSNPQYPWNRMIWKRIISLPDNPVIHLKNPAAPILKLLVIPRKSWNTKYPATSRLS